MFLQAICLSWSIVTLTYSEIQRHDANYSCLQRPYMYIAVGHANNS